jgi:hypothetical protein
MRILITTPLWYGPRTGTARPAFGRGKYHVTLDGETEYRAESRIEADDDCPGRLVFVHASRARELLFTASEMVREDGGRL